jgi:hypothetical protein
MNVICCNIAALVVAGIYYAWRSYHETQLHRFRSLRERVAYMLWVMATRVD